jgi:hypothetical protein
MAQDPSRIHPAMDDQRPDPDYRSPTALAGENDAQRNDFKWAHVEVDGCPVVGVHRSGTLSRLFEQIDAIDPVY